MGKANLKAKYAQYVKRSIPLQINYFQLSVTDQFRCLGCCIPEMEEAIHPVASHEEKTKQGDHHLHMCNSSRQMGLSAML